MQLTLAISSVASFERVRCPHEHRSSEASSAAAGRHALDDEPSSERVRPFPMS